MQYPPPETPSEVYPLQQPPIPAQDIVIYPTRGPVILHAIIIVSCLFAFILLSIYSSPFSVEVTSDDYSTLILFVFLLACTTYCVWYTWGVICIVLDFLIAHKPVLFINHEGITVNRMPTLSSFFISWAEIESISIRHMFLNRHLCIRPKNTNEFLTRFHVVERLNRSSNTLLGTPPLTVAELYLDRPAKEILHLLYYMYTNELSYYHVRLQP